MIKIAYEYFYRVYCIYNRLFFNVIFYFEENLILKQSKLFPCYSIPMRDFFASKGIRYELVGLHPKSNDMFWVYIKTTELEKAMNEWSSNNR